jgi:uncharacterized damage-inducible protein DinB
MQKELLLNMVSQNQMTCSYSFDKVTEENAALRLSKTAASIGFIYRHVAECIHLFCTFFDVPTEVRNTTIGKTDEGQGKNLDESRQLIAEGFVKLHQLTTVQPDEYWLGNVETPFFGTIPRIRLFAHALFHNSHHAGQISMTLARGSRYGISELKQ